MKQTAVEFLHSEYKRIFEDILVKPSIGIEIADALAQAKEMEKQQIIDAYTDGFIDERKGRYCDDEKYYDKTFNK